ncbi:MAG: hypothetical protein AB2A00_30480 [Myxococcota bacterium]
MRSNAAVFSPVIRPMEELHVAQGQLVCFRVYDAADEFDLEAASSALMEQVVTRATFRRVKAAHLQMYEAPLQVRMGTTKVTAGNHALSGDVMVRVFHTGVVSVGFWLEVPAGTALTELQTPVASLMDSRELDQTSADMVRKLVSTVGAAAKVPRAELKVVEEYTVVLLTKLSRTVSAADLVRHPSLPALLLGEPTDSPKLSSMTRRAALKRALSFYGDDLTLIEWNGAFVYDPRGADDVADILEFATQQLVEFRYYDEYLDHYLDRMYDEVELHARKSYSLLGGRYTSLAKQLMLLRVELTEVTEKIDNSLKLVGEPFLARVYLAALERFRIHQWRVSVEEKLKVIDNLVTLIRGEISSGKTIALEAAVVILIVVEILMGLFKVH